MQHVATEVLEAIDTAMQADQGAKFRQLLEPLIPKMEDAYRGESSPFRSHLGASLIGRECNRELYLSFRWASKKKIESRILRLFNRGHLEEARFLSLLQMIGCDIWYETEDGGQFRFSDVYGHFGSALDGVAKKVPGIDPEMPCYAEFKTASDKVFNKIKANGIKEEKFEHYAQMNVCMHEMKLPMGLYMVVNKNDDELYAEYVPFDAECANAHIYKAEHVIFTDAAPKRISDNPTWWKCKYCDQRSVCHGTRLPEVNCRTCIHSKPTKDGTGEWVCERGNQEIHTDAVYTGCSEHVYLPPLLNNVVMLGFNKQSNFSELKTTEGKIIKNGPSEVPSHELKERGL